ncbi:MAG: hypothetical protein ACW99A_14840, partial [Candidatus Kariarchaeaceae archaeon]
MNRSSAIQSLNFFILAMCLISSNLAKADLDRTKIGVKEGDIFEFNVTNFEYSGDFFSVDELLGDQIVFAEGVEVMDEVKKGDIFQIEIIEITTDPYLPVKAKIINSDNEIIDVTFHLNSLLMLQFGDSIFGAYNNFILFTDWTFWEELIKLQQELNPNEITYENDPSTFAVSSEYIEGITETEVWFDNVVKSDFHYNFNYNKKSGVADNLSWEWEVTKIDGSISNLDYSVEKRFSDDGNGGFVPAFEFYSVG